MNINLKKINKLDVQEMDSTKYKTFQGIVKDWLLLVSEYPKAILNPQKVPYLEKGSYVFEKKVAYDGVDIVTDKIYPKLDQVFSGLFYEYIKKRIKKEYKYDPNPVDLDDLRLTTDIIWYSIDGDYFVYQLEGIWGDENEIDVDVYFRKELKFYIKNSKIQKISEYEHEKNKGIYIILSHEGEPIEDDWFTVIN